jgi:PIN domain nuclease of toxin-antitoxin system
MIVLNSSAVLAVIRSEPRSESSSNVPRGAAISTVNLDRARLEVGVEMRLTR